MDLEDADATAQIRARHDDAAIEPTRAQQRGIEHVGPVGRGDDDDAVVRLEAVHLDEQLVERLLALVVTAAEAGAAVAADRVDLVDEDDARRVLLALLEQVADAARADADEHLDEVRAADREERHARFTRDRAREQRLAGAGRAHHQDALRDPAAEAGELLRILQERDDLFDLVLGLFDAGDVLERHAVLVIGEQLRLGLAEAHRLAAARLQLPHEQEEDPDEQQHRQPPHEDLRPDAGVVLRLDRVLDVRVGELVRDRARKLGVDDRLGLIGPGFFICTM